MKRLLFLTLLTLQSLSTFTQEPALFVNPFIGTANKGNTHPGAVLPWGLVSVSPHTTAQFRGAAYYEHGAPFIYGFGHVQLSGVGCNEAGNIVIMPVSNGTAVFNPEKRKSSYKNEIAKAGYYSCYLEDTRVKTELTATQRSGRSRFLFEKEAGSIVLDLSQNKSSVRGGFLRKISDSEVEGFQWAGKFCDMPLQRKVFFVMKFHTSEPHLKLFKDSSMIDAETIEGTHVGLALTGNAKDKLTIEVSVGLSFVSIENARLNLQTEQSNQSFEQMQQAAYKKWNDVLSHIQVNGATTDDRIKFYTAYYHSLLSPVVFNDVNGEYLSMQTDSSQARQPMTSKEDQYTIYSLWDTYRTVHPFLTLVHPAQQQAMVRSMVNMYKEGGWLPKWELYGQESWVMVGDPAPIVIADSYIKGIRDIDTAAIWKAMNKGGVQSHARNMMRPGIRDYWKYGYVPIDKRGGTDSTLFTWTNGYVWGPVSTSLEYYLADYNIGVFSKAIGKIAESKKWFKQSQKFTTLFDPATKMFRPRLANGLWLSPFDPKDREYDIRWKNSGGHGFVEGDAWIYRFFASHDIPQIIRLYGGSDSFIDSLQKMFDQGHFDMTNEPDISYPYLFNYVKGHEWRTQKTVKQCIDLYFNNTPGGIPGNDDAGTLSAWLLFSMMGIYPDCPGKVDYQITIPSFEQVDIQLSPEFHKGKSFTILRKGKGNRIKKLYLNGQQLSGFSITHQQISNGGRLIIELE